MALTLKKTTNFASVRGSPTSDTTWDKIAWDFDARNLMIIVKPGADLEISMDGKDLFMALPQPAANQNPMIYLFREIGISRIWIRKTGAVFEAAAHGFI